MTRSSIAEVLSTLGTDAAKAKEAALAAIDAGSDVILADTDQAARGIFSAAEGANVYVVATYADQASLAPKAILGSVLYDYGALVSKDGCQCRAAANSKKARRITWVLPMASAAGRPIPPFRTAFPPRPGRSSRASMDDIKTGRIKVPELTKPGDADTFDLSKLSAK